MPARHLQLFSSLTLLTFTLFVSPIHAGPIGAESAVHRSKRENNPLERDWSPAPSPQDGPAFSAGALRDAKYLPAQIGGIFAAYGFALVVVAVTLLSLSNKRRERLQWGNDGSQVQNTKALFDEDDDSPLEGHNPFLVNKPPRDELSEPPHTLTLQTRFKEQRPLPPHGRHTRPLPASTCNLSGAGPSVDTSAFSAERDMAQSQLEEMYKHVMDHEDARQRGIVPELPVHSGPSQSISSKSFRFVTSPTKDKFKPATLDLGAAAHDDKTQSKASSFFASLRSPRKKQLRGMNISSPIMAPHGGAFHRDELQEMSLMSPRNYAPPPPPPIPTDQIPFGAQVRDGSAPPTPKMSVERMQSIDQRINAQRSLPEASQEVPEIDSVSATSEHPQTCLAGLPPTPSSDGKFPVLPSSPKPGATFSRAHHSSAVRTGGSLPLRAYEPAVSSPSATSHTTKQTVFERRGPLSPTTGRTPMTAGAVPYSPYQPFTPVVPITPALVTREDRKRMKRLVPKTPTMEMVKDADEMW